MRIVEQLRALGSHIGENIPDVNSGGCCVYAAHTARRLHQLGVPVWGIVADRWSNANLNTVRLNHKPKLPYDWNAHGVGFNHVLIQFVHGGHVWTHDTDTTTDAKLTRDPNFGAPILEGYLTVKELIDLASVQEGWNRSFDREYGIPVIRQGVREFLTKRALQ